MQINLEITSDDLFELYKQDYRGTRIIHKLIKEVEHKIKLERDESEQLEILCEEFFMDRNPENDNELLESDMEDEK